MMMLSHLYQDPFQAPIPTQQRVMINALSNFQLMTGAPPTPIDHSYTPSHTFNHPFIQPHSFGNVTIPQNLSTTSSTQSIVTSSSTNQQTPALPQSTTTTITSSTNTIKKRQSTPLEAVTDANATKRLKQQQTQNLLHSSDPLEQQLQQDIEHLRHNRLYILDSIFDSFNICDVETLYKLIQQHCHIDLLFQSTYHHQTSFLGRNAAFIFWNFAHEAYPDAMIKILERRIISIAIPSTGTGTTAAGTTAVGTTAVNGPSSSGSSISTTSPASTTVATTAAATTDMPAATAPTPAATAAIAQPLTPELMQQQFQQSSRSLSRVEIVYKFTGTRITSRSVHDIFAEFMTSQPLHSTISSNYDDLTLDMVRFVTSGGIPPSTSTLEADEAKSCIMEAVVTFDPETNLIKEWTLEVLAA